MSIEFAIGPGDQGSVPCRDSKMVLDAFLLNTQHYNGMIKGKGSNAVKGVAPFSGRRSYLKGSLRDTLN